MFTKPTTIIEKAFSAYADITSRVEDATGTRQLRNMYHEATTILIDTHEHLDAAHEELTSAHEELTREITSRIGTIELAESAAVEYLVWKNFAAEELTLEDIDIDFLAEIDETTEKVGSDMVDAIHALKDTPGLAKAASDRVNEATEFFYTGHGDLVRDIRAVLA